MQMSGHSNHLPLRQGLKSLGVNEEIRGVGVSKEEIWQEFS